MQTTPLRKHKAQGDAQFWARRHRLALPVNEKTSKRFAGEFEQALKARGAAAKEAAGLK